VLGGERVLDGGIRMLSERCEISCGGFRWAISEYDLDGYLFFDLYYM
jgi:hypothetical protein